MVRIGHTMTAISDHCFPWLGEQGSRRVEHARPHFRVDDARLWDLPDLPDLRELRRSRNTRSRTRS
ncbi:hypothetical protein [Streptomyces sp. NPDC090445]|uniref:hypothetical protein n=1 Tax=Streptomyces sp. NPDC090445 TaxID=3365963 RepID=UPI00381A1628